MRKLCIAQINKARVLCLNQLDKARALCLTQVNKARVLCLVYTDVEPPAPVGVFDLSFGVTFE